MSLTQTVAPSVEPVTVAEAKAQANVYFAEDDSFIEALITAARERTEANTWRQLVHATYELRLRHFPDAEWIEIPCPPLSSITSIEYVDTNGDTQTISTDIYSVDSVSEPGRVILKYGKQWPSTRDEENAVVITFVAGYSADATDVPQVAKQSILMRVATWYEFRETTVSATVNKVPEASEMLDKQIAFRKQMNWRP